MGIEFYERAVEYQEKYKKPGMKIRNAFQTNGVLLNREWAEFFYKHEFLVGVSLDGPQAMHDAYRVDKGGAPTHYKVRQNIEILKESGVDFNILCCVHKANVSHPVELYRYLRDDIGAQFIQFIPIVERDNARGFQQGYRVSRRSVSGRKYGDFLIQVFDEWVSGDIGKVFVQIFDAALAAWCGSNAGLCIFEKTCGKALALEHNGDLYSCDHFVEPGYLLGNIKNQDLPSLVNSPELYAFGQAKLDTLPRYCMDCDVRFICNGECPKNRIRKLQTGIGVKLPVRRVQSLFYTHRPTHRGMRQLIWQNRPPAEIMRWFPPK